MDEKTVPLSKLSPDSATLLKKQRKAIGENLNYRALFDQTGECVFIIGLDLHYIAANQQALSLLGYEENELVGMPVSEVMSLDEGLGHKIIVDDSSDLFERILKRKDGTTLPVEISTSVVYDEKNEPAYIQSIARDISERKYSEQSLKKYSRILSAISDATARLLRSSNIETKIPEVLKSLGDAVDVLSCAIFEINTFSDQPNVLIRYEWNKKGSSTIDIHKAISPFLSSILNITGTHFFNAEDATSNLSFVVMPIHGMLGSWGFLGLFDTGKILSWSPSEREAAEMAADLIGSALQRTSYEETIRLNEARNQIILSALPDLLIRLDVDGVILDYSANPDHPLYIHRDMLSGKKLSEIWPEETVKTMMGPLGEQGFSESHNVQGFTLPFSTTIYESRLSPISQREALVVIRDVTDQAHLNDMKTDFINRASHELRTPLTSSILMTELIQQGGTPEELDQYWRTLAGELNRQKILIDRLLVAGRLESGMMQLENVPIDLIPVIEESITAVKPIANKRKVSIKLTTDRPVVQILGDKSGLQQVFINLINNAVKFSLHDGMVEVNVLGRENLVQVSISDHGLGIPPEAVSHLFERFYRAKNVTIAEIPGSGIGLYIVKSIVEELGGRIDVESVVNRGTTFTVSLRKSETAHV